MIFDKNGDTLFGISTTKILDYIACDYSSDAIEAIAPYTMMDDMN